MSRTITTHQVNPTNDRLSITVTDDPDSGGANHRYFIEGFNTSTNASAKRSEHFGDLNSVVLLFQNGPIPEKGVNGITHEALLAVVADRLEKFQEGPFACETNGEALTHVRAAMEALHRRTRERMSRGVEGTHAK